MNYAGMNLPDAQFALQASSNGSVNGDGFSNPGLQYFDIFNGLESNSSGVENFFTECFPREFIPQMTTRPSALLPTNGDKSDTQNSTQLNPLVNPTNGVSTNPIPADFGIASVQDRSNNGSLDFTKRRNWSQRIIEEIKDLLHVLAPDGRIIYVSPSVKSLTDYTKEELKGKCIMDFIHHDDKAMFLSEFNESIASGNALRYFYRFLKKDQTYVIFESHGHPHFRFEMETNCQNYSNFCRGYFLMARPYLTKNALLLDSFLEHKIENQRLLKRIEQLRSEEEVEEEAQQKWLKQADQNQTNSGSPADSCNTSQSQMVQGSKISDSDTLSMPPPVRPISTPLTKKALEESNSGSKLDSIKDKMDRYEGIARIESIEMLTGLNYREGERSSGISTGAHSPVLFKGDAGISIPLDKETRSDKKRKLKLADEYVCTDCGTLDSPEWRKGPSGPKTLCNACGLRWAKKEKKMPSLASHDEI